MTSFIVDESKFMISDEESDAFFDSEYKLASGIVIGELEGEDLLEKEMATHSSTLALKIPWMEEPGRLQSMGSQRVRHD